ncbi:hypothetical protein LQW54_011318 [Pestalotiopsis sp. IQ-011]
MLNDWYHQTTDELWPQAASGGPPPADNGLINGTNVYKRGGERYQTSVTSGKSYRLRLVNGAINTMFRFSIDGHKLTVIGSDLVAIKPYVTDSINLGMGQRYDVIVTANQKPGNYWLRAVPQTACSAANLQTLNIKGIFNYDSVDVATPRTASKVAKDDCEDETELVPFVELNANSSGLQDVFDIGIDTSSGLFRWTINNNNFLSDWGEPSMYTSLHVYEAYTDLDPALEQVIDGSTTWQTDQQVVHLNEVDQWVYFVIQSVIGWHTSSGFALQLIERQSEIAATVDAGKLKDTCSKWNAFQDKNRIVQDDSGV